MGRLGSQRASKMLLKSDRTRADGEVRRGSGISVKLCWSPYQPGPSAAVPLQ